MPTTVIQRHAEYDPATTAAIGGITGMVEGDRVYDTTTGIPQYRSAGAAWERYTVVLAGQVAHPVGTNAAPGITFDGDLGTGFYHPSPNTIRLTFGGGASTLFDSSGLSIPDGLLSNPSIKYLNDVNVGIYRPGIDTIGFVVGGNPIVLGDAAIALAAAADSVGGDIFAKIQDGGTSTGVGRVGASYTFTGGDGSDAALASGLAGGAGGNLLYVPGDQGSGDGAGADGNLGGFYVGSTTLSPATASPVGPTNSVFAMVRNPNATSGRAWIEGGTSTYLYLVNAGGIAHSRIMRLYFSDGGGNPTVSFTHANDFDANQTHFWRCDLAGAFASRFIIGPSGGAHIGIDGTAASPGLGFINDIDTGPYRPGANQYGITCGTDPIVFSNAAIALAAAADAVGGGIFVKVQDGGTSTGVGRAGASHTLTGGDGSDAALASGLNGGVGGTLNLTPGDGGAGDGAGVAGTDGQVNVGIGGSQTIPAFIIDGDVDTGWYLDSPNTWRFSANGADLLDLSPFRVGLMLDGTKTGPSLAWDADPNVGLYRPAADQLGLTAGGAPLVLGDAAVTIAAANNTNGADVFTKVEDGGTATGATAGFIGADLTWETGDGSAAGGGVNPGGAAGNLNVLIGVGGAGAGGGAVGANGQVIFDLSDSSDSPDLVPGADDEGNVGLAGTRWSLIRGVAVTSGDLNFENGWTFTEAWDDGTWGPLDKDEKKGTKGLYIFNHRKQRVAWLDNEGNIHARGRFIEGWVPA